MGLTDKQLKEISPTKLMVKAMEEAGEVVKAGAKYLIHGQLASDDQGNHYDNLRNLYTEYEQLRAIMIEINTRHGNSYGITMAKLAEERNDEHRKEGGEDKPRVRQRRRGTGG